MTGENSSSWDGGWPAEPVTPIPLSPKQAPGGCPFNDPATRQAAKEDAANVLAEHPSDAAALVTMGDVLSHEGCAADAEVWLLEALAAAPENADAHHYLGLVLHDLGRLDEAEAAYREAMRRDPADAGAAFNLGALLRDRGRLDEAEAAYREAMRLDPAHADAANSLGALLRDRGRLDEAEAAYREAMRRDRSLWWAYHNLGVLLADTQRTHEALPNFAEAFRLSGDPRPVQQLVRRLEALITREGAGIEAAFNLFDVLLDGGAGGLLERLLAEGEHGLAAARTRAEAASAGQGGGEPDLRWQEYFFLTDQLGTAREELVHCVTTREEREHWLRRFQGLAADAAFSALRGGRPDAAVVALERGLATQLALEFELAFAPLDHVRAAGRDDLADAFQGAVAERAALMRASLPTTADGASAGDTSGSMAALRRVRNRLEEIAGQIRHEGIDPTFLTPPGLEDIRGIARAAGRPLIYLAAARWGGLALIVYPDRPAVEGLTLPRLTAAAVAGWAEEILKAFGRADAAADTTAAAGDQEQAPTPNQLLLEVTEQLWTCAIGPVLGRLRGYPRAVLIPAGRLGMLPLHAAWHRRLPFLPRTWALDTVGFTYAPNARSLDAVLRRRAVAGCVRVLGVRDCIVDDDSACASGPPFGTDAGSTASPSAVPAVAGSRKGRRGRPASPPVGAEVPRIMQRWFPAEGARTLLDQPVTKDEVMAALPASDLVLWGVHGEAVVDRPLESHMHLPGGERLSLHDRLLAEPQPRRLEVLASCWTGLPGGAVPDEMVSYADGLLQAGTCAVIAPLYPVGDASTAAFVEEIFATWRNDQNALPLDEAYFKALRTIRDHPSAPSGDTVARGVSRVPRTQDSLDWAWFKLVGL